MPPTLPNTILHTACSLHMLPRRERWKIKCIYTVTDWPAGWEENHKQWWVPSPGTKNRAQGRRGCPRSGAPHSLIEWGWERTEGYSVWGQGMISHPGESTWASPEGERGMPNRWASGSTGPSCVHSAHTSRGIAGYSALCLTLRGVSRGAEETGTRQGGACTNVVNAQ